MFRALRWLGTASLLTFIFALPAQHLLENKAMAVPPFMNISGAVTLGTGSGASNGDVNVTDYNDDFGMAMDAALRRGRVVCVLPGNYTAKTAATIKASGVHVFGFGRPNVTVGSANVSTPAVLNVDSNNEVVIEGITFTRETWIASQAIIDIAPDSGTTALNHVVRDCVFVNNNTTAVGFSDGNEMLDILLTNGAGCEITDNTFYPFIGLSNMKLVTGNMNIISGNKFRNTTNLGLAELPPTSRRPVHRTIHLDNEEWTQIINNYWWALGISDPAVDYDGYRVTNLIYYQGPTGGTEERGHIVIRGNTMAVCTSKTTAWIQLRGVDWAQIEGNFFCYNTLADTLGTGFIVVEGSSGATGDYSTNVTIQSNHIHNPGGVSTRQCSAIYARRTDGLTVQANDFNEMHCEQAVHADCQSGVSATLTIDPDAADNSLTRSAGNWASDGFVVGDRIAVAGLTENSAFFVVTIASIPSATKIIVYGRTIVAEIARAGVTVKTVAVARTSITGNKFCWPSQTPSSTRVGLLRIGTTGEMSHVHVGGNTFQNGSGHYSGATPSGKAITDKGIWDTSGSAETATGISVNVDIN